MTPRNANLIPNEVLSDISDFVPNYHVPDFTRLTRSFAAALAPRLRRINEEMSQPRFISVSAKEDPSSERIVPLLYPVELPLHSDNTLGWYTLTRAFPNAHGLKYWIKEKKAFRALLLDATGTKFEEPVAGEWKGKDFIVVPRQPDSSPLSYIHNTPRGLRKDTAERGSHAT